MLGTLINEFLEISFVIIKKKTLKNGLCHEGKNTQRNNINNNMDGVEGF